ncbi:MAG: VWA domain-containing protein [Bryobacterales bacterium]|nr:VWA domain-containing protein [Bryobacteraceae bacterium]MDW8354457.1 VWA domain-containing protein [Bryobacterales bacterium]
MSFEWPWVLPFVLAAPAWALWEWKRTERHGALVLKAMALAAILAALAQPRLTVHSTKVGLVVLVDTSASISERDLERATALTERIERAAGRHWVQILPFARQVRLPEPNARRRWEHTAGEAGRATDLERALREALGALPSGVIPRLALISDGKENRGSVLRALWQVRERGIPVDTFRLEGRPRPELRLESVVLPSVAFTGERVPVEIVVHAPRPATAAVEISAEGKLLGRHEVALEAGANRLRVTATVNTPGAIELAGTVRAADLGEVRFAQALTLRRPRVRFVSQDPPGTEHHLLETLKAAQFEVEPAASLGGGDWNDVQIIVLNNTDFESIPLEHKRELEEFVRRGGGLLVVGGERNVYAERKVGEDPLERALPAKLAPPRSPEGTCVVLIIDKSSSMEGRKMELARLSAIGVLENLRPIDLVGVLIFDNSFQWLVPIRRADDRGLLKRLVAGIMADGGTQIAPALAEAYRRILPVQAVYKHIVLLTDGISEEGDSLSLAQEAARNRITISTVGLGQDVNRAYLEKVAALSKGKAYFLADPAGLEQILVRDVMEHTGSTAVERAIRPRILRAAEILEGTGMDAAPPLWGYVKYTAKPSADTLLAVGDKDPLLVRWQYGLGRSAVFTSDAKSRWAADWVTWEGFDRFWTNVFRDLLPHAQPSEVSLSFDAATREIVVQYRLAAHVPEPERAPDVFVFGPAGFRRPLELAPVARGVWRGRVPVEDLRGLFRVRPLEESPLFPEAGLYLQEEELTSYGSDERLLRQIAAFTGGRFEPPVERLFDSGGRAVPRSLRLWPALLALAVALNLAEVALRKLQSRGQAT